MRKKFLSLLLVVLIAGCGGKSKEELYGKGLEELKNGNPNAAIVLLKNALEKDQNFVDARYQLAVAYLGVSKFEQAEREFQKVLRLNPTKTDIKLKLAKIYNKTNKADEALKVLDEYLTQKPGDAEALEYKGIAYAIKKQIPDAERYLLEAIQADTKRDSAKLELATVYAAVNRDNDARNKINEIIASDPKNSKAYYLLAQLENSRGNRDKALEIYQKITEMNQSDAFAYYQMGMIYLAKNDLVKVEQIATDLTTRFPKRGEGIRLTGILQYTKKNYKDALASLQSSMKIQPSIEGYYYLGLTQYASGQLEGAINQFRSILDRIPSHNRSRLMIGIILQQQKRFEDSIAETRKVIDAEPQNALAHNVLGSAYLAKGQFDEGMRELNRATELDPKIIDAHVKKGLFHLSRGKEREGEAELQAAININPEILNTRLMLFSYYERQNNHAKALAILNQGITGKKEDAPLYNALASVMANQKKPEEAVKYLQKAKTVNPEFYQSYFNLASYYASRSEHDKAAMEYKEVLSKDPQNLQALLSLAGLYELKGQDKDAFATYTKAKETKNDAAFLALAGYYGRKKENNKAIGVLDEALKANSKNIAALELKGRALVAEKKFNDAIKVFDDIEQINQGSGIALKISTYVGMKNISKAVEQAQRIITLKPNSALGYMVLSSVYESQNDFTHAIDEIKKGVKVEPTNPEVKMQLGKLYIQKKDYTSATGVLSEIIREKPDFAPAHFALGSILEQTGKKKDAVKKYRDALAKADKYIPALNNLAYLCADGYGSKEEALRLAVKAYELSPGSPEIMDTLGYVLIKNGKIEESLKVFEVVIKMLPKNPTVQYHYALALKEKGDNAKASDAIQKALQMGEFTESTQARQLQSEIVKGGGRKAK